LFRSSLDALFSRISSTTTAARAAMSAAPDPSHIADSRHVCLVHSNPLRANATHLARTHGVSGAAAVDGAFGRYHHRLSGGIRDPVLLEQVRDLEPGPEPHGKRPVRCLLRGVGVDVVAFCLYSEGDVATARRGTEDDEVDDLPTQRLTSFLERTLVGPQARIPHERWLAGILGVARHLGQRPVHEPLGARVGKREEPGGWLAGPTEQSLALLLVVELRSGGQHREGAGPWRAHLGTAGIGPPAVRFLEELFQLRGLDGLGLLVANLAWHQIVIRSTWRVPVL